MLQPALGFEQVRPAWPRSGGTKAIDEPQLDQALTVLGGWGLLEASQNHAARYATPEEFERRNVQWSLTAQGQVAIGGVLHALDALRQVAGRQPAVVEAIADGLADLHDVAGDASTDAGCIATRLAEVESHLISLVTSVRQFNTQLQRLMRDGATSDEVFGEAKRRTVVYLQKYIDDVERPTRRVQAASSSLLPSGWKGSSIGRWPEPTLLPCRAPTRESPGGTNGPAGGMRSGRRSLRTSLPRPRAPRMPNRRSPRWWGSPVRQSCSCYGCSSAAGSPGGGPPRWGGLPGPRRALRPGGGGGRRLSPLQSRLRAWPARHAHLACPDAEAVPASTSWSDAPPVDVPPVLRMGGLAGTPVRVRPVADPGRLRAACQREQAEALARAVDLRSRLVTHGPVRLSSSGIFPRGDGVPGAMCSSSRTPPSSPKPQHAASRAAARLHVGLAERRRADPAAPTRGDRVPLAPPC